MYLSSCIWITLMYTCVLLFLSCLLSAMPSTCQEVRRGVPIKSAIRMSSVEIPDTNEKSSASPSPCPSPVSVFAHSKFYNTVAFFFSFFTVESNFVGRDNAFFLLHLVSLQGFFFYSILYPKSFN